MLVPGMVVVASGIRWVLALIEAMPQANAGLRSDPPMSLPRPIGLIPDAMAAASPPLEPATVTSGFQGFRVNP